MYPTAVHHHWLLALNGNLVDLTSKLLALISGKFGKFLEINSTKVGSHVSQTSG